MNRRSFILFTSLLTTTILSAEANPFKEIKELESFLSIIKTKKYRSIPSPRTFYADPSHTAAGVLHYAIDKKKGPVILLGLRNDEETYCNLGGMSDNDEGNKQASISGTLAQTASREVEEESNGYYAHHPYDLERQPFIDVLRNREKKGSLLYRMYWKKVPKVEGDILFKAIENGQHAHNNEYKAFSWVPVKKILASLNKGESTITIKKGQKIELFEPLFTTLSTDSGLAFLNSIDEKGIISRFDKNKNRLYVIDDEEDASRGKDDSSKKKKSLLQQANFKSHWELPAVSNAFPQTNIEVLGPKKKVMGYKVPFVPFGKNAWGQKKQTLTLRGLNYTKEISLSSEKDEKDFAYAVAAHGAAMVELKNKAEVIRKKAGIKDDKKTPSLAVEEWNPDAELSLSRIHLRIVLGEKFKTADDFKNESKPQRAADIANLRLYLTTYKKVEYDQKKVTPEFKRQISFLDEDLETFADILEWEEQHHNYPSFYHAATAEMNNLWYTFTHLRELLSLSPLLGQKIAMRGTDIYFRNVTTMKDILETFGTEDYENGRAALVLCANYVLAAGLQTTRTTSSSIEYFLNNHSVAAPNIEEKFAEATALAGIVGHYPYLRSAFLQYLAHRNPTFENSVMVGLSIPPHLLDDHSVVDCGSGPSNRVLDIFKGIQNEYENHKETPEPFEIRSKEKKDLIPEARISLHPTLAFHSEVKIKAFNRFPLSAPEQKLFENEMRQATLGTLADWLTSHSKVIPGSFAEYPALKRLYNFAYKAITGQEINEIPASAAFTHLIRNNHVDGVKEFVKTFPAILNEEKLDPHFLAFALLREDKQEMFKYLSKGLFKKSLESLFKTPKEFYKAVRVCLHMNSPNSLDYLLSKYDLKSINEKIIQAWVNDLQDEHAKIFKIFLKHFAEYSPSILKFLFKNAFVDENSINALIIEGVRPQLITEEWLKSHHDKISKGKSSDIYPFFTLIQNHTVDLSNVSAQILASLFEESLLENQIEALLKSKISPQLIAEECLKSHHDKISNGKSSYIYSFFTLIQNHTVDLSNVSAQVLASLFEESLLENQIEALLKSKISPQLIAEEWLKSHHDKISNGKSSYIYSFFTLIQNHTVDLSNVSAQILASLFEESLLENQIEALLKSKVPLEIINTKKSLLKTKTISEKKKIIFTEKEENVESISPLSEYTFPKLVLNLSMPEDSPSIAAPLLSDPHESIDLDSEDDLSKSLNSILKLDDYDQTLKALKKTYTNVENFLELQTNSTELAPFILAVQEEYTNSILAILDYVGNRFPDLAIAMGEDKFEAMLECLPDEKAKNLIHKFPDVFVMINDKNDFFESSLRSLPLGILKDFIITHKNKLKDLGRDGYPYFFMLLTPKNMPLAVQLAKEDPSLLKLESLEGISLKEGFIDVAGQKQYFDNFMKDLKK